MTKKVFTVYDSKAKAYMQPFFMLSNGEAIREFSDVVNDPKSKFFKHPGDFTLFEIGEYDELTAIIKDNQTHTNLGCALEYKDNGEVRDLTDTVVQKI